MGSEHQAETRPLKAAAQQHDATSAAQAQEAAIQGISGLDLRQLGAGARMLSPGAIMMLQRTVGNAAVNQLLGLSSRVQPVDHSMASRSVNLVIQRFEWTGEELNKAVSGSTDPSARPPLGDEQIELYKAVQAELTAYNNLAGRSQPSAPASGSNNKEQDDGAMGLGMFDEAPTDQIPASLMGATPSLQPALAVAVTSQGSASRAEDKPEALDQLNRVINAAEALRRTFTKATDRRVSGAIDQFISEGYAELRRTLQAQVKDIADDKQREQILGQYRAPQGTALQAHNPLQLITRYRNYAARLDAVATKTDDPGKISPVIAQTAKARGDMYHVKAVLGLIPEMKVILYDLPLIDEAAIHSPSGREQAEKKLKLWGQAAEMARYYNNREKSFYLAPGKAASISAATGAEYTFYEAYKKLKQDGRPLPSKQRIGVGGCTTLIGLIMADARAKGDSVYAEKRGALAEAIAPDPQPRDATRITRQELKTFLGQKGFVRDEKYLILNYRGSGHLAIEKKLKAAATNEERHKVVEQYEPDAATDEGNHPELDTGVTGLNQLRSHAEYLGFIPVFMGEEPAEAANQRPNLFKYWEWEIDGKKVNAGGRAGEAYVLRVLHEEFGVKALAMRSGVTDQLAFLGIPVISIDIDTFHRMPAPDIFGSKPGSQGAEKNQDAVDSWARGSKLEAGLGRDYGRVFLQHPRDMRAFAQEGKWSGGFHPDDRENIVSALKHYFMGEGTSLRHTTHPLHPSQIAEMESQAFAQLGGKAFAQLGGKVDTNLNPEAVLLNLKLLLTPPSGSQTVAVDKMNEAVGEINQYVQAMKLMIEQSQQEAKWKEGRKQDLQRLLQRARLLSTASSWQLALTKLGKFVEGIYVPAPQPV